MALRRSVFVKITASGRKLLRDVDRDIEKGRAAVAKRLATEAAAVPAVEVAPAAMAVALAVLAVAGHLRKIRA